jgi:hypothetical protein
MGETGENTEQEPKRAGAIYGVLLTALLAEENQRKASLEQRSLAVISTAGALISLILALTALVLGRDRAVELTPVSKLLLVAAIIVFVLAAVAGLFANRPRMYIGFSGDDIDRMVSSWEYNFAEAEYVVGELQARSLKAAIRLNNQKGRILQLGVAATVIGVTLVAGAVVTTLVSI